MQDGFPLGATGYPEGVNFSAFSKGATGVELLLFEAVDSPQPDSFERSGGCSFPATKSAFGDSLLTKEKTGS
jgi:pullulanase/glycogen debranching enzyme